MIIDSFFNLIAFYYDSFHICVIHLLIHIEIIRIYCVIKIITIVLNPDLRINKLIPINIYMGWI